MVLFVFTISLGFTYPGIDQIILAVADQKSDMAAQAESGDSLTDIYRRMDELHAQDKKGGDNWWTKAIEPAVITPLLVVILSGMFWIFRKSEEEKKELGRLQFIEVVTTNINDTLSKAVSPRLDGLEQQVRVISERVQVQQVKNEGFDHIYKVIEDKVTNLEKSLIIHFDHIEGQLDQSLSTLPCVERMIGIGLDKLRVKPCPNQVEPKNRFYPQSAQRVDELDL